MTTAMAPMVIEQLPTDAPVAGHDGDNTADTVAPDKVDTVAISLPFQPPL